MQIGVRILPGKADEDHVKIMTDLRMPGVFSDIRAGLLLSMPGGKQAVWLLTAQQLEKHRKDTGIWRLSSNEDNCIVAPKKIVDLFPSRSILLVVKPNGYRYLCVSDYELISILEGNEIGETG